MKDHQLINQTSGDVEYYTPDFILHAARRCLGGRIELDPASSVPANKRVGAERIFTAEVDGLSKEWHAETIWMNHPFGRLSNPLWIDHLVHAVQVGRVKRALCITFAATSEGWFQQLFQFPMCFLSPRTNYVTPDGKVKRGCSKGSVVTYLDWDAVTAGDDKPERFVNAFFELGAIK